MYHFSYHQGNLVLKEVCKLTFPHLNIIDGYQGMEGNGPADGIAVDWRIAIAGTDALAVDALVTYLMGFDLNNVGYLNYLKEENFGETNLNIMEILGEKDFEKFKKQFKTHYHYQEQIQWKK